ncbi:FMN-binding protein [Actinomadura sp. NAK00032]|uniref:FMN-binding protein n=1 Tax=Actinomadura sp. NAK00032 TaxID=2742128 RepID=UPI0015919BC2|nr:FMN-binding protein [Actinomadura sp. NAK00032]QKW37001.1 FMN-binding protein [Actinomadura sp. NAK00032]
MRRATIATGTTIAGVVLLLSLKPHHQAVSVARPPAPEPPAPGGHAATATNATYRGQSVDTRYGPVQVEITMSKGRLTAVRVLRAPSANGRDREIAAMALPRLTREAVAAGGAHIDAVSGATYTSEGYITSLQSALDRAHA